MSNPNKLVIREWSEADRPREKLLNQGRRALTDAELLAILIGSGSKAESAVELCRRILVDAKNNLHTLSTMDVNELSEYNGIGEAKAITIIAALELARRKSDAPLEERKMLNSSKHVYDLMKPILQDLPHEEFWTLYLNTGYRILEKQLIGRGGNDFTPVDVRIILRTALSLKAHAIILVHNHPSGTLYPSNADKILTQKIADTSKIMDIRVADHLIFTDNGYYSFKDEGVIE
ncbi:DNA repair protein RadC [Sphingobacterium sp.]|uniref:RadC family protein n=1 Tax=Sphingobacterium sp. TaxID=341027 RepID=UPI00289C84DA|nr:DNA repair protein RadC [Sphingobacterium sp.]